MSISKNTPVVAPQLVAPIVSTQWLADHLGSDGLVILDATVLQIPGATGPAMFQSGLEQFSAVGHIPGAQFADVISSLSDPHGEFAFTRPDAARFAAAVEALGIRHGETVVVYDAAVGQWAARVWWLFRTFGYDQVAVLDGGLTKWNHEERPLEVGEPSPTRSAGEPFHVAERPELWADKNYIERVVAGEEHAALVCAAPHSDFTGESGPRARLGHIPGSHSVPAAKLVNRGTRAFLAAGELKSVFAPALKDSSRIVLYCGGGIAAAEAALALILAGHTDVAVYDGSLNEWAADPAAPLEVAA